MVELRAVFPEGTTTLPGVLQFRVMEESVGASDTYAWTEWKSVPNVALAPEEYWRARGLPGPGCPAVSTLGVAPGVADDHTLARFLNCK